MKILVKLEGRTPTLTATENKVKCILTLGKSHDITTAVDDTNGLANRSGYSHRGWFGQYLTGVDYLQFIKEGVSIQTQLYS